MCIYIISYGVRDTGDCIFMDTKNNLNIIIRNGENRI